VRFCEYLAVDVQGVDCARLGITAGRNFCVVSPSPCVDTHYELKDGDCNVTHYVAERESFTCTSGTPTFLSR
jgi:hypothetical protein